MELALAESAWTLCLGVDEALTCTLAGSYGWLGLGGLCLVWLGVYTLRRGWALCLTWRAMAWTPWLSRHLASWVRTHAYTEAEFLRADGAGDVWAERRHKGLDRLAMFLRSHYAASIAWGEAIRESFSDLRFTDAHRVPFPFMPVMRDKFNLCSVVTASHGPRVYDLDGHWTLDIGGSYGVNVAGFERYKLWMQQGLERVKDVGPVLGPLHPLVADNIARLKAISRLDEVSLHMSGTEAVMAAVRLARFNTRRKLIVCFSGAYHGWWDGVQPGLGSERGLDDCLTLKDMDPASLAVIRHRAREIAAVLVNPIQAFHPNTPPPSDAVLLTSGVRHTQDSTARYADWLRQLRQVCRDSQVPLLFDEVYSGFRLAPGGAQEYFGVQADLVVYGKTVAGGMPIGVVCGTKALMRRFDPAHPMRVAYVLGTFAAHPVVMGAMQEFLRWVVLPDTAELYAAAQQRCAAWVQETNQQLMQAALPLRVVHLATVWTVLFTSPSRYNWLLQYYLRAEGVTLTWVGTGRCLSSLDFTPDDYQDLQAKLLKAARAMQQDGWWLSADEHPGRDKHMRVRLVYEGVRSLVPIPKAVRSVYTEVMRRKADDHHASHNDVVNQVLHLVSSSVFIGCYALIFTHMTLAMWCGLGALFLRQFGHAVLEPPCHDQEATLLGFNTRKKTLIVLGYVLVLAWHLVQAGAWTWSALTPLMAVVAYQWWLWTLLVVGGRVVYLTWVYNLRTALIWAIKLLTDPFTDIGAYLASPAGVYRAVLAQTRQGARK